MPAPAAAAHTDLVAAFRRLYFHLYGNSNASRAERLVEELSLILLAKLALEQAGTELPAAFLDGSRSANQSLLPVLRQAYPELPGKDLRFTLSDASLRHAFRALGAVSVSRAPGHVLGDAFQALMGPRLRGDKGQFFTPRALVRAMVEIVAPQPGEHVLDPACGTGGFLAETHAYQARGAGAPAGTLTGIDKDEGLARLAAAQLHIAAGRRARICCFNALADDWDDHGLAAGYDVVLTNPPFGARIAIRDPAVLERYDFGHQWAAPGGDAAWRKTSAVLPAQDPQVLFIELCVRRLRAGGRMAIVLPEGIFGNRQHAFIWDWLRAQGTIAALLDCPRTTFQPGTDTKTNVLFFDKRARPPGRDRARVAVALHCGHDRRGRPTFPDGSPRPDDLGALGRAYHRPDGAGWCTVEIADPGYLVPRYYVHDVPAGEAERALLDGAAWASLGELVERGLLDVRKGHEVGADAYGTGDVPFVRTSDIANFEIAADPSKGVSEEVHAGFRDEQRLRPGNVIMVVDGRYRIGATALITSSNLRCVVQSHFRILEVAPRAPFDEYALLFALDLPSVKLRIRNLVFVQSTLGTLGKRLYELRIPLLGGAGPWRAALDRFREALTRRAELLGQLRSVAGADIEL
jgi:type I restriction enzyme M protein